MDHTHPPVTISHPTGEQAPLPSPSPGCNSPPSSHPSSPRDRLSHPLRTRRLCEHPRLLCPVPNSSDLLDDDLRLSLVGLDARFGLSLNSPPVEHSGDAYPLLRDDQCADIALAPRARTHRAIRKAGRVLQKALEPLCAEVRHPDPDDTSFTASLARSRPDFRNTLSSVPRSHFWLDLVLRDARITCFPHSKAKYVSTVSRWCLEHGVDVPHDLALEWEIFSNSAWYAHNRILEKIVARVYNKLSKYPRKRSMHPVAQYGSFVRLVAIAAPFIDTARCDKLAINKVKQASAASARAFSAAVVHVTETIRQHGPDAVTLANVLTHFAEKDLSLSSPIPEEATRLVGTIKYDYETAKAIISKLMEQCSDVRAQSASFFSELLKNIALCGAIPLGMIIVGLLGSIMFKGTTIGLLSQFMLDYGCVLLPAFSIAAFSLTVVEWIHRSVDRNTLNTLAADLKNCVYSCLGWLRDNAAEKFASMPGLTDLLPSNKLSLDFNREMPALSHLCASDQGYFPGCTEADYDFVSCALSNVKFDSMAKVFVSNEPHHVYAELLKQKDNDALQQDFTPGQIRAIAFFIEPLALYPSMRSRLDKNLPIAQRLEKLLSDNGLPDSNTKAYYYYASLAELFAENPVLAPYTIDNSPLQPPTYYIPKSPIWADSRLGPGHAPEEPVDDSDIAVDAFSTWSKQRRREYAAQAMSNISPLMPDTPQDRNDLYPQDSQDSVNPAASSSSPPFDPFAFADDDPPEQPKAQAAATGAHEMMGKVIHVASGGKPFTEEWTSHARTFSTLWRGLSDVQSAFKWFVPMLLSMMNAISKSLGNGPIFYQAKAEAHAMVAVCKDEHNALKLALQNLEEPEVLRESMNKLMSRIGELKVLVDLVGVDAELSKDFDALMTKVIVTRGLVKIRCNALGNRVVPVGLYLIGKAGCGKTQVVSQLVCDLAASGYLQNSSIYDYRNGANFQDGWSSQATVLVDECFTVNDAETRKKTVEFLLGIVNSPPYQIEKAMVEEKGLFMAKPDMLIATSNCEMDALNSLLPDMEAIYRRLFLVVRPIPPPRTPEGSFPKTPTGNIDWDQFQFNVREYRMSKKGLQQCDKVFSYQRLLSAVAANINVKRSEASCVPVHTHKPFAADPVAPINTDPASSAPIDTVVFGTPVLPACIVSEVKTPAKKTLLGYITGDIAQGGYVRNPLLDRTENEKHLTQDDEFEDVDSARKARRKRRNSSPPRSKYRFVASSSAPTPHGPHKPLTSIPLAWKYTIQDRSNRLKAIPWTQFKEIIDCWPENTPFMYIVGEFDGCKEERTVCDDVRNLFWETCDDDEDWLDDPNTTTVVVQRSLFRYMLDKIGEKYLSGVDTIKSWASTVINAPREVVGYLKFKAYSWFSNTVGDFGGALAFYVLEALVVLLGVTLVVVGIYKGIKYLLSRRDAPKPVYEYAHTQYYDGRNDARRMQKYERANRDVEEHRRASAASANEKTRVMYGSVRHYNAHHRPHAQVGLSRPMANCAKDLVARNTVMIISDRGVALRGVGIVDRCFVMPHHYNRVIAYLPKVTIHVTGHSAVVDFSTLNKSHLPDHDITYIELPHTFPSFRDISKKFMWGVETLNIGDQIQFLMGDGKGNAERTVYHVPNGIVAQAWDSHPDPSTNDPKETYAAYSFVMNAERNDGDCGSLYAEERPYAPERPFFAMHVAGCHNQAYGTLITQEILTDLDCLLRRVYDTPKSDPFASPFDEEVDVPDPFDGLRPHTQSSAPTTVGNYVDYMNLIDPVFEDPTAGAKNPAVDNLPTAATVIGRLKPEWKYHYNSKSKIVLSPCAGYVEVAPHQAPALLSSRKEADGSITNPLTNALKRIVPPVVEEVDGELMKECFHACLKGVPKNPNRRLLTASEAVAGVGSMGSMDGSSSPGVPFTSFSTSTKGNATRKDDFYWVDTTRPKHIVVLDARISGLVDEAMKLLSEGKFPLDVFSVQLKDETLPHEKVQIGKTRAYYAGDTVHTIIGRMLLGSLIADLASYFNSRPDTAGIAVGMTPDSLSCNFMSAALKDRQAYAMDQKSYDTHQTWEIAQHMVDAINAYYPDNKDNPAWSKVARATYLKNCYHSAYLLYRVVFTLPHMMPSGVCITSQLNSLYLQASTIYVICKYLGSRPALVKSALGKPVDAFLVKSLLWGYFYGDDSIFTLPTKLGIKSKDFFEGYARLGLEATHCIKDFPLDKEVPVDQMTFLKRQVIVNDDGVLVFALEKNTIEGMLTWSRNQQSADDVTIRNNIINSMLTEAARHGKKYFQDIVSRLDFLAQEKPNLRIEFSKNIVHYVYNKR